MPLPRALLFDRKDATILPEPGAIDSPLTIEEFFGPGIAQHTQCLIPNAGMDLFHGQRLEKVCSAVASHSRVPHQTRLVVFLSNRCLTGLIMARFEVAAELFVQMRSRTAGVLIPVIRGQG